MLIWWKIKSDILEKWLLHHMSHIYFDFFKTLGHCKLNFRDTSLNKSQIMKYIASDRNVIADFSAPPILGKKIPSGDFYLKLSGRWNYKGHSDSFPKEPKALEACLSCPFSRCDRAWTFWFLPREDHHCSLTVVHTGAVSGARMIVLGSLSPTA